jgi:hypothetical protein
MYFNENLIREGRIKRKNLLFTEFKNALNKLILILI